MIQAAEAAGHPAEEIAALRKMGPRAVKDWAEMRGIDPEAFAQGDVPPIPGPGELGDEKAGAPARPREGQGGPVLYDSGRPDALIAAAQARAKVPAKALAHQPAPVLALKPGRPADEVGVRPGARPRGGDAGRRDGDSMGQRHQGASWMTEGLQHQLEAAEKRQGSHRDERALLAGTVLVDRPVAAGGVNTTRRVALDNGVVGFFKPFDGLQDRIAREFGHDSAQQPVHEAAAWTLASRMGRPYEDLVPPCVIRDIGGQLGSLSLERPGLNGRRITAADTPEHSAAAFFDALIGQQDRHHGNFLMAGDRITLIDHGFSFACEGDYSNWGQLQHSRYADNPSLTSAELATLDALLDSPDLFGLEGILEPERAQALRSRAETMRVTKQILPVGTYA